MSSGGADRRLPDDAGGDDARPPADDPRGRAGRTAGPLVTRRRALVVGAVGVAAAVPLLGRRRDAPEGSADPTAPAPAPAAPTPAGGQSPLDLRDFDARGTARPTTR
jgi:hypothetical protein